MAQFDVCVNRGKTRNGFPFFVVVQSNEFADTPSTMVVPVTDRTQGFPDYAARFVHNGTTYVADALGMFPIPTEKLGPVVGTLTEDGEAILASIDRILSTAY